MAFINYVTQIQFDFGAVRLLRQECERVGITRPLIVTDQGVKAAGVLQKALDALGGMPHAVFDQTPSNPTEAAVRAAAAIYQEQRCDGLIAVGGFAVAVLLFAALGWLAVQVLRRLVHESTAPRWLGLAPRAEVAGTAGYQSGAWQVAYLAMAASMAVGMLTVLLSPEPVPRPLAPARNAAEWLRGALVEPFADFLGRYRWQALLVLGLIAIYRISDVVMGIMANPFYVDMGFTKDEVAAVTKVYGVIMTLAGAFLGGALAMRWGVMRVLMLGAALSPATNLLFAWLATRGHDVNALVWVVSADNLAGGIASAAFIAYLSGLTNVQYSATQYALFSSMMLLAPKWLAGFSGAFVDAHGYVSFFQATALLGLPVLVLIALASRVHAVRPAQRGS